MNWFRLEYQHRRRGIVAVFLLATLIVLLGFTALTVDVGFIYNVRTEMQTTADAAALAAAQLLPDQAAAKNNARQFANYNNSRYGSVVRSSDVVFGHWDASTGVFTTGDTPVNGVHVRAHRSVSNGNPVNLFFAPLFGISQTDVSASATATAVSARARFLIDDEVIDTDEPAIEQLAAQMGVTAENLLKDNNADGFIDIPGGKSLVLRTGQTGDEGLFLIAAQFEFTETSSPSLVDFLLYNPNGDRQGISDSDLDPLVGVDPVPNHNHYASYVNPNQILVSPIYKSDVSNTSPWVQAKGERRGLWAYKIIDVGIDPDGGGSRFKNLIFLSVDPDEVDLNAVTLNAGSVLLVE